MTFSLVCFLFVLVCNSVQSFCFPGQSIDECVKLKKDTMAENLEEKDNSMDNFEGRRGNLGKESFQIFQPKILQ